jgi:hypothetical protein
LASSVERTTASNHVFRDRFIKPSPERLVEKSEEMELSVNVDVKTESMLALQVRRCN